MLLPHHAVRFVCVSTLGAFILTLVLYAVQTSLPVYANEGMIACTMDAKQCPDGSFVGRVAPDCSFAPCPNGDAVLPVMPERIRDVPERDVQPVVEDPGRQAAQDEVYVTDDMALRRVALAFELDVYKKRVANETAALSTETRTRASLHILGAAEEMHDQVHTLKEYAARIEAIFAVSERNGVDVSKAQIIYNGDSSVGLTAYLANVETDIEQVAVAATTVLASAHPSAGVVYVRDAVEVVHIGIVQARDVLRDTTAELTNIYSPSTTAEHADREQLPLPY